MLALPAPNVRLRDLPLPELSEWARDQLDCISMFLYAVNTPAFVTGALLADYSQKIHNEGVYYARVLAGDRSFGEWRQLRSLRPPSDPDLPDLIAELDGFFVRWRPRVVAAVSAVPDAQDRAELEGFLLDRSIERPSRTWRAKSWAASVKGLRSVPVPFYQSTWAALVAEGIEADLVRFHQALETVQQFILTAPLDEGELAEINEERERFAERIETWLEERRAQLERHFDEESLTILGLGDFVPLAFPDMPFELLAHFGPNARA